MAENISENVKALLEKFEVKGVREEDFASLADYLLWKKFSGMALRKKRIDFRLEGDYLNYVFEINGKLRFLVVGLTEEKKVFTMFSDVPIFSSGDLFFTYDAASSPLSTLSEDGRYRVQGDVVFAVRRYRDEAEFNRAYEERWAGVLRDQVHSVIEREILLRVGDVFSELGVSSSLSRDEGRGFFVLEVEGVPDAVDIDKVKKYIADNIFLDDLFGEKTTGFYSKSDPRVMIFHGERLVADISVDVRRPFGRREKTMFITVFLRSFGKVIEDVLKKIPREEGEEVENWGRHEITFKNVLPRAFLTQLRFFTKRSYLISAQLNVNVFTKAGTEVILRHQEHGEKRYHLPPLTEVVIDNVSLPYRTAAQKNMVLLKHFFSKNDNLETKE